MITVPVEVKFSGIHGMGVFAAEPVKAGTVVWVFNPDIDTRQPVASADDATMHHGYVNPARPDDVVACGDEARWWNFAHNANCGELFRPTKEVESVIVALRDIAAGEEMTITEESDADAERKLKQ